MEKEKKKGEETKSLVEKFKRMSKEERRKYWLYTWGR